MEKLQASDFKDDIIKSLTGHSEKQKTEENEKVLSEKSEKNKRI